LHYRPEIDGLRAVAVVPVILFHANPSLISGGYLGVDIFFVISGFLITLLLIEDLQEGRYSLARFYERRLRRILPALLVMVAGAMVLAWGLMLPRAFGNAAHSAAATGAFLSNVFFWQTTDYFDIDALAQPLLHTWSLAVEEQFYIVFPVMLALVWQRVRTRSVFWGLVALTLASLALAQWGTYAHPKVNYYFTLSRFWELLFGSIGAFSVRFRTIRPNGVLSGLGLVAILGSMVLFRQTTAHPGVITLIPTLGALLILVWADFATPVGRGLSLRPMVGIGKISYSLYLWHFPIFSFAAAFGPVSAEAWHIALQIAVIAGVSAASWRFVETPFRVRRTGRGPAKTLWVSGAAIAVTILLGQTLGSYPNLTLRYGAATTDERAMLLFSETYKPSPGGPYHCFFAKPKMLADASGCIPPGRPDVVVWGDSHAAALAKGFEASGIATGLLSGPGCGPMLDDGWTLSGECAAENLRVMEELRRNPPTVLVLHAYWRNKRDQIRLLPGTIAVLRAQLPATKIVVMGGGPYWIPSLPERIVAEGVLGQPDAQIAAQLDGVIQADDKIAALLADEISTGAVSFIRPTDLLCHEGNCRAYAGAAPYASDYGHLTDEGALDLVTVLKSRFPEVWAAVTP
jgi:peptidoglycan/LPS O-acetylase OafA/YrhL